MTKKAQILAKDKTDHRTTKPPPEAALPAVSFFIRTFAHYFITVVKQQIPQVMKRKTDNFNKFYNKKRNSAIKEQFRQEKKAAKKERKEAIERRFEEKRQARGMQSPDGPPTGKFARQTGPAASRANPGKKGPYSGRTGPTGGRNDAAAGRYASKNVPGAEPVERESHFQKKLPGKKMPPTIILKEASAKPGMAAAKGFSGATPGKPGAPMQAPKGSNPGTSPKGTAPGAQPAKGPLHNPGPASETLPLNKYIAHGGICSRRDAADLIRAGKVSVNGQTITEPGTKVLPTDTVKVQGKKVTISRNFVYILLNKPKDYITTTEDPQGRKTVLDLIRQATTERVFPVGRLDRNTSGVLLLTNDGDLSQKLAHPSHEIKKIYHVSLDKALTKSDFDKIIGGEVHLEDGAAVVDVMAYADPKDKTQIGLEIHSGRNRIVRRIFEHLGYDVRGLDRVMYAGLTKKNVQRGKWRLLTEKEIRILKYLNSSIKGSPARAKEWAAVPAVASAKGAPAAAPAAKAATAKGPAPKPGKRPVQSIPPKGRKPTLTPAKSRPHKSTNFNKEQGD
jgi:23S rRNA pseudouridine2605 synthase